MERLTGRRDGRTYIVGCPDFALPKIVGLIIQQTVDRLAAIEDILCDSVGDDDPDAEDEYDLDRLSLLCNQRMSMREEVSQRFSLTAKIPLDRLRELAEADREGRCVVFQPGYAVVSIYNSADEDGLYTMKVTGVITKEEYDAALRREQE